MALAEKSQHFTRQGGRLFDIGNVRRLQHRERRTLDPLLNVDRVLERRGGNLPAREFEPRRRKKVPHQAVKKGTDGP
jgi:hypothetical protein